MISKPFIEELRRRIPMVSLVISSGVRLRKSGSVWEGRCPFHNDTTPSLKVWDKPDPHFHCYGCGKRGDCVAYVEAKERLSFVDAVKLLADEAGMVVLEPKATPEQERAAERSDLMERAARAFQRPLCDGHQALDYLRGRGITTDTVANWMLGYAPYGMTPADLGLTEEQAVEIGLWTEAVPAKPSRPVFSNRIVFPIRNRHGVVIGFTARALERDQEPKYLSSRGLNKAGLLYGIDTLAPSTPPVVVEGQMDVLTLRQAGFSGAVAPLGTAFGQAHLEALWQLHALSSPILCFDGDEPGRRATAKAIETALPLVTCDRTLRIAAMRLGEDPASELQAHGSADFQDALDHAAPFVDALYRKIADEADLRNPEGRGRFRHELMRSTRQMQDKTLAAEYRREFSDRFWDEARRRKFPQVVPSLPEPLPLNGERVAYLTGLAEDIRQATADYVAEPNERKDKRRLALAELLREFIHGEGGDGGVSFA